jgi:hypothetical protein
MPEKSPESARRIRSCSEAKPSGGQENHRFSRPIGNRLSVICCETTRSLRYRPPISSTSHQKPQWCGGASPGVAEFFPGAGGGGGVALKDGARVTPISGFFVGDGGLGVHESRLRTCGAGLAGLAAGGGGGGGGAAGAGDAAGGGLLGAGWPLLGRGAAVVDASGVTVVACSDPRDTRSTPDTTIAAAAIAASAAAGFVRYHGGPTRTRRCSMSAGFQVPIGPLAGRSVACAVTGTSSSPKSSGALRRRSCSAVTAIGSVIASSGATIGVGFGVPRIGVLDVLSSVDPRYGARRLYRPHKGRRQQRFVGGAAKDAAFHQSVDAPHGTNPSRVATQSTHRKSPAAYGSLWRRFAQIHPTGRIAP